MIPPPLPFQVPSLVLGPFGCGKTRTLSECIKLLTLYVPEARILVCTHSNSAADLYVEAMSKEWRSEGRREEGGGYMCVVLGEGGGYIG